MSAPVSAEIPPARPTRRLRTRVAALAIGAVAAMLLMEAALRCYNPISLRLRGTTLVLPTRKHATILNPGSAKLDPSIEVVRNDIGFRGPNPPADFADRLTIVTVGGSTTECCFLSEGKTWTDELARILDRTFRGAWVNNGGLDGHSTFGHVHLLRQFLVRLKPRYAVFLVGINDVGRDDLNDFDRKALLEQGSFTQRVIASSEALSTLQALIRARRAADLGVGHAWELDLAKEPRGRDDPGRVSELLLRQGGTALERYRERLRVLVSESRAAGIEPVLVTQSALYMGAVDAATGQPISPLLNNGFTAATNRLSLEMYNDATREIARESNTLLIDLGARLPADSRYYYDWVHYTNAGAEAVAGIIAADLVPYLRARHPEFVREK